MRAESDGGLRQGQPTTIKEPEQANEKQSRGDSSYEPEQANEKQSRGEANRRANKRAYMTGNETGIVWLGELRTGSIQADQERRDIERSAQT
jgi:hypothetical protein